MKKIGLIFVGLLCIVAALTGYSYLKKSPQKSPQIRELQLEQERRDYQNAVSFLQSKDYKNAGSLIKKHIPSIEKENELGARWFDLFIRLNTETSNIPQLEALYQFQPTAFLNHEDASLLLAESWLNRGKLDELEQLRQKWLGNERKHREWQLLDAEALILEGRRDQAIALLESQHFEGSSDTPRLTQLALLHLSQNPKKAWGYLEIANEKDPNNPTILTYRAKLLESIGQTDWAQKEYAAAAAADRENVASLDQLIDFHVRHEQLLPAMEALQESLNHPNLNEELAVKALFWNRMVEPLDVDWKNIAAAENNYPFYNYLLGVNPPYFWNESTFKRIENNRKYSDRSQVVWWLRLLSALQENNDKAAEMLHRNPFAHLSWNPSLELAFKRILRYREKGTLYLDGEMLPLAEESNNSEEIPNFFEELDILASKQQHDPHFKMPKEYDRLLHSNEAIASALLAAGWNEAAIEMLASTPATAGMPEWVNRQFGLVLLENRGVGEVEQHARQAHYSGDIKLAQRLYQTILDHSTEAKSYLARQAFVDQEWLIARELTLQLLKEHPDNRQLWDNLSKIDAMLIPKNKQQ